MGAMNKANGRQNTKHKARYKVYADRGVREANKKRNIAQDEIDKQRAYNKLCARVEAGKPVPKRFLTRYGIKTTV